MRAKVSCAVIALVALLFGAGAPLRAEDTSQSVTSHGLKVYFGFVPAAVAQDPARRHGEANQHAAAPAGDHSYHLIVVIFNAVTGERITDATITASGLAPSVKTLEPMKIADTISYGNFFELPKDGIYRIRLSVTRQDKAKPIVIDLTYDHHIHGHRARE